VFLNGKVRDPGSDSHQNITYPDGQHRRCTASTRRW
jgi:hypothetical protein